MLNLFLSREDIREVLNDVMCEGDSSTKKK